MKKYILFFLLLCHIQPRAQEDPAKLFVSPLDFPLYLSANFGELRSNHFHGGLDIKTQNAVGKQVRSIANGYVSRVTVSFGGFGKVIYITHPNGYTSLYGHVMSFNPEISAYVENYQYEQETFEADLFFSPGQFPVRQGDVIALSGNEGYSLGPHLHLEIRKTENQERVNPLLFYRDKIKDNIPPRTNSITLYAQPGKGELNGLPGKQTYPVQLSTPTDCLQKPIEAWGDIGLGIEAFDYMNGTNNNYGIYSVTLYVDNQEQFNSVLNTFLPTENRMINSFTDFNAFRNSHSWIMKSFIAPGNTFRGLTSTNDGIIRIDQEREYRIKYVLSDYYGNTSVYGFSITGKKRPIPSYRPASKHFLSWNKPNIVQEPGLELIIPKGNLYEDIALNCSIINDSNALSYEYRLHNEEIPLHTSCELLIGVRNRPVDDRSKYYIIRKTGKYRQAIGGTYENGWIKAPIRELGTYTVALDTIPPKVVPVGKASWGKAGAISIKISDGQSGIKDYKGKIDGKFALFAYNARTGRLSYRLDPRRISKGGRHELELAVTDRCGNKRNLKETFIW